MTKKISKCAMIRTDKDGNKRCPFGLPITEACEHAGDSVGHMAPLEMFEDEEKREQIEKANKRVYVYHKTGKRCIFAEHILKDYGSVNCNWGDHGAGAGMPKPFVGSPLYPQTFSGIGLDSLYAFPLGFYADNNQSRNLFHGLFSLVGEQAGQIIKNAIQQQDENLWEKMEKGDILLPEEQDKWNMILGQLREEFEESRNDPAKMRELIDKWNPRKKL